MVQTTNRFFDEVARLMNDAAGVAQGVRREFETLFRTQAERWLRDLANVYTSFPELKALATEPLLRDTMISPGQSAQGMVLLHFPVTQAVWDHRRNAMLNVDLYHQGEQQVLIGRASEALPAKANIPSVPSYSPPN